MAERREEEPWSQLATRIPKELHRRLKLHCVESGTSVMDFVVAALREKLATRKRAKYPGVYSSSASAAMGPCSSSPYRVLPS